MNDIYCDKCNANHKENDFYINNNKSKLSNGEYKVYPVYRCKKYFLAQRKEYCQNNITKILEHKKQYYKENKEIISKKAIIYREKNNKEIKENKKIYYEKNKESMEERNKIYRRSNYGFMNRIISRFTRDDKKKGYECDITYEFLKELLEKQQDKCFLCNVSLAIDGQKLTLSQPSLDRVNNNLGHTKENVNWVCFFCNHSKNINSYEDYKNFIDLILGKNIKKIYNKYEKNNEEYKHFVLRLIHGCKGSDKLKNKNTENLITKNEILDLIKKQNNKCKITGLKLINTKRNYFLLKPSVDRIDNSKPHILDNCQIVCLGIQLGKVKFSDEEVTEHIEKIKKANE